MSRTIVALFNNHIQAENAAKEIRDQGLKTSDISIVAKQGNQYTTDTDTTTEQNTAVGIANNPNATMNIKNDNISDGVVTGGILGGLAGLLLGAGTMIVPGLGIIAAAGPITGLISGAVTGGVVGGLIDLGIPEQNSKTYESEIKSGKVLFSMLTEQDKINQVTNILKSNEAINVNVY